MTNAVAIPALLHERQPRVLADGETLEAALATLVETRWKLTVFIQLAEADVMHFGELRRAIPGIRTKGLTLALRALERDGLILREVKHGVPTRVAYELTSRGATLLPVLGLLAAWMTSHRSLTDRSGMLTFNCAPSAT